MAFEVVHADGRHGKRETERAGDARAHQERARQARPCGIGDALDRLQATSGLRQRLPRERQDAADVVARSQFGHHPPILGMHGDLGVQRVRQQAARRIVKRHAGFVAGGFDT